MTSKTKERDFVARDTRMQGVSFSLGIYDPESEEARLFRLMIHHPSGYSAVYLTPEQARELMNRLVVELA